MELFFLKIEKKNFLKKETDNNKNLTFWISSGVSPEKIKPFDSSIVPAISY